MFMVVGLIGAGFAAGVALTTIIALHVYGQLHAEAAATLESYGMMLFPPAVRCVSGRVCHVDD
jgi:hypothetical protein